MTPPARTLQGQNRKIIRGQIGFGGGGHSRADFPGGIKISEEDFNRLKFVKDLENPTFNDIKEHIINLCPEDERIKMKDDWDEIYPTVVKLAKYTYGENRPVWFTISRAGDYYISMYYDNKLNRADGSDL